jgi:hypothetical protein
MATRDTYQAPLHCWSNKQGHRPSLAPESAPSPAAPPPHTLPSPVAYCAHRSCSSRAALLAERPATMNFSTQSSLSRMSCIAGPCTSPPAAGGQPGKSKGQLDWRMQQQGN